MFFGVGLLLVLANLTLCAALSPSLPVGATGPAERMRAVWRIFFLALIQIGAWALLLEEAGVTVGLEMSVEEAASCFVFLGSTVDGADFVGPELIALNGLLFIPVSLLSCASPRIFSSLVSGSEPVQLTAPVAQADSSELPPELPVNRSARSGGTAKIAQPKLKKPDTSRPFRGSVPPLEFPPEIELLDGVPAEEARYAGPPPPAIRFHTPSE